MERLYYLSHWLYERKIPFLPRIIMILIRFIYGSFIPYQTKIGEGVSFGHKMGIVISRTARIGARVKIRHFVTIGSGGAIIEDDVQIGAGAKIIGNVRIGENARIGANAVVVDDVPPGATVVGIPARIIKTTDLSFANDD
ncbi:MAG: serine O-acetyltransferase [Desulfobulbaceae bacterium]|nr:serine O-acetyltransferase [Desulfobulbaceae bacterium]HIJ91197.1 serine acetyltransferase [Deltaproteobacteria bacterium]